MNTTIDFLEAVKAKSGVTSDYAVAKKLEITRAAVSKYRQRNTTFDDETAIKVAEILNIEPATVLAAVHAERAKTDKDKTAWKLIYERLGGIAASVLVATLLTSVTPAPAQAASAPTSPTMYIMSNRKRRKKPTPFAGILAIFQQFSPAS